MSSDCIVIICIATTLLTVAYDELTCPVTLCSHDRACLVFTLYHFANMIRCLLVVAALMSTYISPRFCLTELSNNHRFDDCRPHLVIRTIQYKYERNR